MIGLQRHDGDSQVRKKTVGHSHMLQTDKMPHGRHPRRLLESSEMTASDRCRIENEGIEGEGGKARVDG